LFESEERKTKDEGRRTVITRLSSFIKLSGATKGADMNCWHCERPAHGACIFCGRAICKEHVREMPHIVALYRDSKNAQKAIVTARALFCGVCEPREDPVEIPELK
jgi:hypothetical protein